MVRKASLLIAEAFDERDIKYTIREIGEETSVVDAGFSITCGPNAHVLFASSDEENDVAVRITGLMQNIPQEKRAAVLEACNAVNDRLRYLKFCIHDDDLVGEYDLPVKTSDECLAECCVEGIISKTGINVVIVGNGITVISSAGLIVDKGRG